MSHQETIYYIIYTLWYLLIVTAILFFISGLDELFFDIYFWTRHLYRKWKTRNYKPLTYETLSSRPEQKIAILVACWHEQNVIAQMLQHNVATIDYLNYDFFVGVYPNDLPTMAAVQTVANKIEHVIPVINPKPGPSSKSDNLNSIYSYIVALEQEQNITYDIFVFHDSEDIIHPLSLKLFNYLIPHKDMVQLPVFPLEVPLHQFTHWVYNDEFAENHTKNMIVREAINSLVPSAGVATGFSRQAIIDLAHDNNGLPFLIGTFTEDYHTALAIRLKNLPQIFALQTIMHTKMKKRWIWFGKLVPRKTKEYIAARALFPTEYSKAVRQKARWVMGISMQEWGLSGWAGNFATRYTLLHDRKTLITHFINIFGYLVFLSWIIYLLWQRFNPAYPTLQDFFNQQKWVWYLILGCTFIMLELLVQRMIAVYRVYGLAPALLSIPRAIYGNFMNMNALLRAYWNFFITPRLKKERKWDKTDHTFPSIDLLNNSKQKLGNLLLNNHLISKPQLTRALSIQMREGSRLGDILVREKMIDKNQLINALARQYHLIITKYGKLTVLKRNKLPKLARKNYRWLIKHAIYPIAVTDNRVTLVINDLASIAFLDDLGAWLSPYQSKLELNDASIDTNFTKEIVTY